MKYLGLVSAFALTALGFARAAHAETNIVREPERHPFYAFELEPHLVLAPVRGPLPGGGARGTIVLSQDGFISSINDSVGLGFGFDATHDKAWLPVVMQWNFWLSEHWSVFGEPGIAWRWDDRFKSSQLDPTISGGARLRLASRLALTARVGYPGLTLGVSFLL